MARLFTQLNIAAGIALLISFSALATCKAQVPPLQYSTGYDGQKLADDQSAMGRYQGYANNMREDLAQWKHYKTYAESRMRLLKGAGQESGEEYQTLSRWLQQEQQDEPVVNQRLASMEQWIGHYQQLADMDRWNMHQDQELQQEVAAQALQQQQAAAWHNQLDQMEQARMNDYGSYGGYGGYGGYGRAHYHGGHINLGGHFSGGGGGGHMSAFHGHGGGRR